MQLFIILLLLGSRLMLSRSRPTCLVQGNDSEAEAEYEGNDDTAVEDYLRDDQESTMEEAQQKSVRHEDVLREPQEQADSPDFGVASSHQDKYRYEIFPENNSGSRKERQRHGTSDLKNENEKDYLSEKQRPRNSQQIDEAGNIVHSEIYSRSNINQMKRPQSDSSINGRSVNTNPEYGEMLFKMKPAQTNRQNNLAEEVGEQSRMLKQFNDMHLKNKEQENENTFRYDRDRRHAQNVEEKQITDSTCTPSEKEEINITNESSESAIIKNIKKLSEQDLEELLNSLPDDKKALLKKIMDKREITKKAGAVDESSYLEGGQADTSKLEGGYSVYCNTESSATSDTPETSKQPESSDSLSSKTPDSESGSRSSGSKSEIINNTDMKNNEPAIRKESGNSNTGSQNVVSIYSDAEEISKNENKRETNNKDLTNEKIYLDDSKIQDYQVEVKDSNDFLVNQEDLNSENEDWLNEPQESNTRVETVKREILQKEPLAIQDSGKLLKDSFPASNTYEDNIMESEMAPLKRVKRTEKEHQIKKRDLSVLSNVHFSPGVESEDSENEEKSEFEDFGVFDRASNLIRSDQELKSNKDNVLGNSDTQCRYSQFDKRNSVLHPAIFSESQNNDKMSLGSDTDSVLSGIEGVDDNLMYNRGLRGQRALESSNSNSDEIKLNRNGRTAGPMNVDVVSDNSINVSQYQDDGAFGPVAVNSEEDVSRFKRVRQIKQDSQK